MMKPRPLTIEQRQQLEQLVDATSLADVLEALSRVCDEKESHLRTNWQDYRTAAHWHRASCKIVALASTETILEAF